MFKYILSIMICFDFMLALDKHDPEVYESIEEPLSEIVRKTRQYGEKYKPPVFIYDKTTQPDLRKWRYFQQQQIDSKNLEKVFSGSPSAYAPSKPRDKDQTVSETQESSLSLALKPRWKIIHPKFVTEKDNDFSPRELVKMQEQYGRRQSRRMSSLRTNNGNDRNVDNNSAKRNESKPVYMVKEFDLETDASEISEVQSPLDKRDQLSFILPNTFEDNSQTVRMPTFISEPIAKATSQSNLDNLKHNQNDMDALNSLLGNTHVAQIHGFKQLLHSQPMQVASLSNGHTGHMPLVNQQYFDAELIPQPVIIPANNNDHIPLHQIQNILQTGGQTLEQIQLQLDDLSRKEGEKAIAEAQQKAIEYVKSQQAAIAQAEIEGEQIAIAAIKAHNLQLPEALPKSLPLIQSQSSLQDTSTESGKSQQSSENSIPEHDEEQKLLAADSNLQTQTYLVSHQNTLSNQEVGNSLGDQVKNNYILSYPEMNHNGLSGVNNAHALNKNVEHVQQQVEAYETSSSKAHLQPLDIVQNGQSNSKNIQVSFQHEHNVSSNIDSKYLFNSFDILNTAKHNRTKRQNLDNVSAPLEYMEYYDYSDNDVDNGTTTEVNNFPLTNENLPTAEKLIFSEGSYYNDYNYDESNSNDYYGDDNDGDDVEMKLPVKIPNRRYSRWKHHIPKNHYHKHFFIKKPDIAIGGNSFDTISKIIPTKHNASPTVILINNNNGNANHNNKYPHRHKYRNTKKLPTFRKTNYSKIDRKIRKALINLRKLQSRHFGH